MTLKTIIKNSFFAILLLGIFSPLEAGDLGNFPNAIFKHGVFPLHELAEFNSFKEQNPNQSIDQSILELINKGYNINGYDLKGFTPLHLAAVHGHIDTVISLLNYEAKTEVTSLTKEGMPITPLGMAFINQQAKTARPLIEHGASPLCAPRDNITAFHMAVHNNDNMLIHLLCSSIIEQDQGHEQKEKWLNTRAHITGQTAIHLAVVAQKQIALRALLENGANPNITDNHNNTALDLTALDLTERGQEMALCLISYGAFPTFKKYSSETPSNSSPDCSPRSSCSSCSKKTQSNKKSNKPEQLDPKLFDTSDYTETSNANTSNINANLSPLSPLFSAAADNNCAALFALLEQQYNPNIINKNGQSPLHVAASKGHDAAMRFFYVTRHTNFDIIDSNGYSPLDYLIAHASNKHMRLDLIDKIASRSSIQTRENAVNKAIKVWAESGKNNGFLIESIMRVLTPLTEILMSDKTMAYGSDDSELTVVWRAPLPITIAPENIKHFDSILEYLMQTTKELTEEYSDSFNDKTHETIQLYLTLLGYIRTSIKETIAANMLNIEETGNTIDPDLFPILTQTTQLWQIFQRACIQARRNSSPRKTKIIGEESNSSNWIKELKELIGELD